MLHCKNCKKKFYLHNEGSELDGKVIECKYCNQKWSYESKTKYLENRLAELSSDLDNTESKINLRKKEFQEQIIQLEDDLQNKKDELQMQKILQDKIATIENRLKDTEKLNYEELELKNKIKDFNKQIKTTSENISSLNNDIEEKTNYLEKKINSYDNIEIDNNKFLNRQYSKNTKSDVVDINRHLDKSEKITAEKIDDDNQIKKNRFFSPNFVK